MKRPPALFLATVGAICCAAAAAPDRAASTTDLIAAANAVLERARTDNVAAAKDAGAVFAAASRLSEEGSLAQAEQYYSMGLQLAPWEMDEQIDYASTLLAAGKADQARAVARMVLATAERQAQLDASAKIAGAAAPAPLPPLPAGPLSEKGICLVALGPVDDWLLQKSGRELSEKLGAPVFVHSARLELPEPHRSFYQKWSENLKNDVVWDHPFVRRQMEELKIESRETATAEQTTELLVRLLTAQGEKDARARIDEVARQVKERDRQWDAEQLLAMLERELPRRDDVALVGFTGADIYGNDNNFLFALARNGRHCCVVSYRRFTAEFNADRSNQKRLLERVHKQLLTSVGFALGVPRPTDPRSARSYPNNLQDHDAKGTWLAPECVAGFERALGHPLPEKTRQESSAAVAATP